MGAAAAVAQELAKATDELHAGLRAVPADGEEGRAEALKQLSAAASALLTRERAALKELGSALGGPRGKRAISMLGEAGEKLTSTAARELDAEQERAQSLL